MDRRERFGDLPTSLLAALGGWQAGLWTAMPAIINTFDAVAMTCTARVAIKGQLQQQDGTWQDVEIKPLLDVPVVFPSGGGFILTFPVAPGDECLIILASRCIDAWWQLGGVQPQMEFRMHDLSDGFAIVGPRSQPRVVSGLSTTATQLRSADGATCVEVAPGKITLTAADVVVHASHSYAEDVNGYGQKTTFAGGSNFNIDKYTAGAAVTTTEHGWTPPGPLP